MNGELDPVEDSAGIGKWGLMGLVLGWGSKMGLMRLGTDAGRTRLGGGGRR